MITYTRPMERVLFCPVRRINPFLHFFEPLWILAGRNDVEFMKNLVGRFAEYSDDGKTFNAAYGHRLRYPNDQIEQAILRLKKNPDDRQVVLQIRHPDDMWYFGKDTACNISIALKIRDGRLNIHVFNRSNDAIWGGPAGGANFPQFTTLQEYLAGSIGCMVGWYHHTTDSMHAYVDTPDWKRVSERHLGIVNLYSTTISPFRLFTGGATKAAFDHDLQSFFTNPNSEQSYTTDYFKKVVAPMWETFKRYRDGQGDESYVPVAAEDWGFAVRNWLKPKSNRAALEEK